MGLLDNFFLGVNGAKGDRGLVGPQGRQGPEGEPGLRGASIGTSLHCIS